MKTPDNSFTPERKNGVKINDLVSQTIERPYEWEEGVTEEIRFINAEVLLDAIEKNEISEDEIYDHLINYREKRRTLSDWLISAEEYERKIQASTESTENQKRLATKEVEKWRAVRQANPRYLPICDNTGFELISSDSTKLKEIFGTWLKKQRAHVAAGEYKEMSEEQIAEKLSRVTDDPNGKDPVNINVSLDYPKLIHNARMHDWICNDPDRNECYAKMIFTMHTRDLDGKVGCTPDLGSILKLTKYFKEKGLVVNFDPMWGNLKENDARVISYRIR